MADNDSNRSTPQKNDGVRGRATARKRESSSSESNQATSSSWNIPRGRSRVRRPSNPFSEEGLKKRGYHAIRCFDKTFYLEKRWKLIRELGSGAYGVAISAADDISGEPVAIKMVTRVFEKVQLAKRALRELTLLRHFNGHENITGLIDVDAITPQFNDMYLFLEPMEADLHQIIKSGQPLTNEHIQYFTYQILRGMKYIHSASVVHRDLKPGNLLVNSDCELKICDFGLSRGFDSRPGDQGSQMTEYVATRWYRAPEIMLAFKRYNTAIDVWSIGCILAELLLGKPLFKGKDYVDQLNKILDVLGTPEESIIRRIGTERAQAYVRSLPFKPKVRFSKIIPTADPQALDLLEKMLSFDPSQRITVPEALQHPWLAGYHDVNDEPDCPRPFMRWREIEKLETIEQLRDALWKEIEDYRREVREIALEDEEVAPLPLPSPRLPPPPPPQDEAPHPGKVGGTVEPAPSPASSPILFPPRPSMSPEHDRRASSDALSPAQPPPPPVPQAQPRTGLRERDPLVSYARRASVFSVHSARGSIYEAAGGANENGSQTRASSGSRDDAGTGTGGGGVPFPARDGYVVPARSRTASMAGSGGGWDLPRKLLRTLSTVSIYESVDGEEAARAGAGAPIARYIWEKEPGADAPASEMPGDFKGEEKERWEGSGGKKS
ncbi:Pkinase-domain-containing protein [Dentipellis sp. KUC8613]|nr:Pkinase-domain-containing protein [Dentipellis sp. KUC8613]